MNCPTCGEKEVIAVESNRFYCPRCTLNPDGAIEPFKKAAAKMERELEKETVEHPDHYNWIPGIECLDVVEHFNFNLGNAIKYIWRAGRKDRESHIEDLKKACFYLTTEIARVQKEKGKRECQNKQ